MTERTVLVTGATGLLGREVSASFGLRGWNVKGTGYSRADGISTLKVDLSNESEVASLLEETKSDSLFLSETGHAKLTLCHPRPQVIVHCKPTSP